MEKTYKIFLDDLRSVNDIYPRDNESDWEVVRNLTDFKELINTYGPPFFISFDNDLGSSLEEGKDAAKWIVWEKELDITNTNYIVHSANSSGVREYVLGTLDNWKKELKKRKEMLEIQTNKLVSILNSLEFKKDILEAGGEIYAVGGIVRDAVMGKPSDDLDIVVRGIQYEKLFSILERYGKTVDTSITDENGKKDFGATKFISHSLEFNQLLKNAGLKLDIDVMLPRKDSKDPNNKGHRAIKSDVNAMYTIYDDLARRDITINAIALDLEGNFIDNGYALKDITNGIIRAVSVDSFIEDPLRILRAIRFAARFNFEWDGETLDLIKSNVDLLSDKNELPRERFLMEFEKMIGKTDLGRAVKLLVEVGAFESIFGIKSKIDNYTKFDVVGSIAEFCFLLFEGEGADKILSLSTENITTKTEDINYLKALNKYLADFSTEREMLERINILSSIYSISSNMLLTSSYVCSDDKQIAEKFFNGELPKTVNDIALRKEEFLDFMQNSIGTEFNPKKDFVKMGNAKKEALQAIYKGSISNNAEEIKQYLTSHKILWLN